MSFLSYFHFQNSDQCENVTCYPGKMSNGSTCLSLVERKSDVEYSMKLRLMSSRRKKNTETVDKALVTLRNVIQNLLRDRIGWKSVVFPTLFISSNYECYNFVDDKATFDMYIRMRILDSINVMETDENLIALLEDNEIPLNDSNVSFKVASISSWFISTHLLYATQTNKCRLHITTDEIYSSLESTERKVSKVLTCNQIEIDFDKLPRHIRDDYFIRIGNFKILNRNFITSTAKNKIRMCIDHALQLLLPQQKDIATRLLFRTYETFSAVSIAVSLTCSCLTFVTFCIFEELRTFPVKLLMALCLNLILSQSFLFGSTLSSLGSVSCYVSSIFSHYVWLCLFLSMGINSVHMYKVFRSISHPSKEFKLLVKYTCLIYISPLIIVCPIATYDRVTAFGVYGYSNCFLPARAFLVVAFVDVFCIICSVNIILFSKTIWLIRNTPTVQKSKDNIGIFRIVVTLSTMTGISWILVLVDSFFAFSAFSFIATLTNALYGCVLFVSFVCNKKVLLLYISLCTRKQKPISPQTSFK